MKETKIKIQARITPKQLELVNNQSGKLGVSFSETIRAILNKYYKLN